MYLLHCLRKVARHMVARLLPCLHLLGQRVVTPNGAGLEENVLQPALQQVVAATVEVQLRVIKTGKGRRERICGEGPVEASEWHVWRSKQRVAGTDQNQESK
jgi:hypothetical protein